MFLLFLYACGGGGQPDQPKPVEQPTQPEQPAEQPIQPVQPESPVQPEQPEQPVTTGESEYWNKEVPEKIPANPNGKLVLFDVSHISTAGASDWVIDGAFSDFADALAEAGYHVKEYRGVDKNNDGIYTFFDDRKAENIDKNEWIITFDAIKDADVFVLAESNRPFRGDEYAALKQFLDAGKGIYFISDHYNADRNMNTWDSTETFNGYNRSTADRYSLGGAYGDLRNPGDANKGWLAETFGIRFRFNGINCKQGASDVRPPEQCEGLTEGTGPVLIAAGATLAIVDGSKAKGLVYLAANDPVSRWGHAPDTGLYFGGAAEGPYVAISKPGKGKAAFIGDSSPIEDQSPKYRRENGGKKKTHPGWTSSGNAATLSMNIIRWLATPEEYESFGTPEHPRGTETPTPMADIEKQETEAEPWTQPDGFDPWNPSTYAPGAYGAALPASQGSGPVPGDENIEIILAPDVVYKEVPFVVVVSSTANSPELGVYIKQGGEQKGQVLQTDGSWSPKGYTKLPGPGTMVVTVRVTGTNASMSIRLRTSKRNKVNHDVRGIASGWSFIQQTVEAEPGDIAAAVKDGIILGTALVDQNKNVNIAVKDTENVSIEIYDKEGKKK